LQPQKQAEKTAAAPKRIVTIPKETIVTREGKSVVFQVDDNKVHQLPVVTGADLRGQVIVTSGVVGSETLVSNPPDKLKDGDSVKIKS
jgi:hypothetical protein